MSRVLDGAPAQMRVALAAVVSAVLAVALPTVLMTSADVSATAMAVLAVALVALLSSDARRVVTAARSVAAAPTTGESTAPVLPGRVTDPVRHPICPRAPGLA